MNANAKKWVKALRSGKFKQAVNALEVVDEKGRSSYCCLGVACVLAKESGLRVPRVETTQGIRWGNSLSELPRNVIRWLGLRDCSGFMGNTSLAALNDSRQSFKKIARLIESEPEGLFTKG